MSVTLAWRADVAARSSQSRGPAGVSPGRRPTSRLTNGTARHGSVHCSAVECSSPRRAVVMAVMTVSQCCCGCSLRTGAIAIGYFYAITGVVASIICSVAVGILSNMPPEKFGLDISVPMTVFPAMGLAFSIIQTAVSVCLVYGVMQEKVGCLSPWIIFAVINAVLSKMSVISLMVVREPGDTTVFIPMAVQAVQAAMFIYFLMVVCSYRKLLLQPKEDKVALVEPHKLGLP